MEIEIIRKINVIVKNDDDDDDDDYDHDFPSGLFWRC